MADNSMTIEQMLNQGVKGKAPEYSNSMSAAEMLSYKTKEKVKTGVIDYLDAAGQGISKAIGGIPALFGNMLKLSADSISGKGKSTDEMFEELNKGQPKLWSQSITDRINPMNLLKWPEKALRRKVVGFFEGTDIDERIADYGTRVSASNKVFIETGFSKQKNKMLQFTEDVGAGSISLATALGIGAIAGPLAAGIVFGVSAKASGYQEALDADKSYEEAAIISDWLGIVEWSLEFWGVHSIIRSGGGVIKRGIKGIITEFIQEFSQTGAEGTIKTLTGVDKQEFSQILQNALYVGSIGAVLGGASAVSVASAQKSQIKRSLLRAGLSEADATQQTNELMNKASEEVMGATNDLIKNTYETRTKENAITIKALGGQELTPEELSILETIHKEKVDKGLIKKEGTAEVQSKAEEIVEANIKEGKLPKVTPETIKQDVSGKTILVKQIEAMEEREDRVGMAKMALDDIETMRDLFKGRIRKYEGDYLKEELTGIPTVCITKEGGITPDEALEELRNAGTDLADESALKEYLQDLESSRKQLKETIQEFKAKMVTKKETTLLDQRVKDIERGIKAGKIAQKKDIKQAQEEIIARIQKSGLELRDKGKLLRSLKNIKVSQERIDKLLAEAEKRGLVKKVLKQPKHPEKIVDVKYQKQINEILNKLGDKKQTRKKSLNAMSVSELVKLAGIIAELKETGKKVFQSKKQQIQMASEIMNAALIKAAGGTKGGVFAKGSIEEQKAKRASGIKKADINFLRPLRMIKRIFGKLGEEMLYDPLGSSATIKNVNLLDRKGAVHDSMRKNKITYFNLGRTITLNSQSFSVNNILRMYLATQDEKSYKALLFGNNISKEQVDNFINEVKERYPKYITFADEVQKIVGDRFDAIAKTMADMFNVEVEKVKVYFPLLRKAFNSQESLNEGIESEFIFEQVERKGDGFSYTSANDDFTISRETMEDQFQTEISLNFMGDAFRAIEKQEHLIAYAPLHKAFNKIIQNKDIQDAVKYNHSDAAWRWLNDYMKVNINPDSMQQGTDLSKGIVRRVRLGLSKAYLGFNVVTAMKQFPSAVLALKYTTPQDIAISMSKIALSKKARENVYKLDPDLRNRVVSRDFNDLLAEIGKLPDNDIKRALLIASKSVDKAAFTMIMQMDKYAVLSVYDAVYRHQRRTKSEAEAKNIAHKAVIETQPQGGIKDLPQIYRTNNEMVRMSLMFTNQLNQIWNMIRADSAEEISKGQYAKATTGIASVMLSSTLIYLMSHGRLPEDPDDFIEAIFGTFIASIPIIGNYGMAYFRGFEASISPAASILKNVDYTLKNIKSGDGVKAMEKSLFLLAVIAQMPYSQLRRTIKGAIDISSGMTDDFRRLIWSEFVLENQ